MLITGVWGLVRWRRGLAIDQSYLGTLLIGELLLIAQMLIGLYLWLVLKAQPGRAIHLLYGFLTVFTLPAVYVYTQGRLKTNREQLFYALATLFLTALLFRAASVSGWFG